MYICKKTEKKAELNILNGVRTSGEVSGIQKRFALCLPYLNYYESTCTLILQLKKKKRTEEQLLKLGRFS